MTAIAVLIPYHDEGELLGRCLRSLAVQSRQVDEILIYDDSSTVPPEPHLTPGLPVRVIRGGRNIGPSAARNVLLGDTQAPWIHFHDADDEFAPDWCQQVSGIIDSGEADAVCTEVAAVSATGERTERILGLGDAALESDFTRFCIRGCLLPIAVTCRRTAALGVGGYRESLRVSEDWDFHIRLAASGIRFRLLTEPLVVKHGRTSSLSRTTTDTWRSALDATRLLASELPPSYAPDLADATARIGSMLFKSGRRREGLKAFRVARALGRPRFRHERVVYRTLARAVGPEITEYLASAYRWLTPSSVRRLVAGER